MNQRTGNRLCQGSEAEGAESRAERQQQRKCKKITMCTDIGEGCGGPIVPGPRSHWKSVSGNNGLEGAQVNVGR